MISEVWESLKTTPASGQGMLTRRVIPDAPVAVYAAISKPKNTPILRIVSPTEAIPVGFTIADASGFSTTITPEEPGPRGTIGLELELLDSSGESVFFSLVDDILTRIEAVDTAKRAMSAVAVALSRWHAFFRQHGFEGLSRSAQQGLFGELLFLRQIASSSSAAVAVQSWSGPSGSNQDFEYANHAFEVKTTAANPLAEVRIANLRQLDDQVVESLNLIVIEVECHENADNTLVDAVEEARALVLQQAPQLLFEFADKLLEYGYLDRHALHYRSTGYGLRAIRAFEVSNDFPRLTEDDVPSGVGDVRYSIAMSAMEEFELPIQEFTERLEGWFRELGV